MPVAGDVAGPAVPEAADSANAIAKEVFVVN